jgi:hypothetical protein
MCIRVESCGSIRDEVRLVESAEREWSLVLMGRKVVDRVEQLMKE